MPFDAFTWRNKLQHFIFLLFTTVLAITYPLSYKSAVIYSCRRCVFECAELHDCRRRRWGSRRKTQTCRTVLTASRAWSSLSVRMCASHGPGYFTFCFTSFVCHYTLTDCIEISWCCFCCFCCFAVWLLLLFLVTIGRRWISIDIQLAWYALFKPLRQANHFHSFLINSTAQ